MHRTRAPFVLLLALAPGLLALALACGGSKEDPCLPTLPGVAVFQPGIDLVVRDASGRGEALGDTVITYRGSDSVRTVGFDTLHALAGFGAPGTYAVRVKRRYYVDAVIASVVVPTAQCGGPVTQQVPVSLALAPGAPALRSIDVFGGGFLAAPGATTRVVARFDADPSVPTTVTWRLSDSSVATVDATGLLTAKCTTKILTDTVTAVATSDTTVRARSYFQVAQQASCP
ncbi:MAG TPA: Ig-like domain-containing protein [Gemmatimonadaceae bacterium]|nr:Ig-like domain-containing protein [Gemmatimonadaceae bacterium]